MELQDKVFVVTGGGNGIGRQLVLELLRRDARVAAVDIRQESLEETAQLAAVGDRLSTHVVDITDREAVEALPDAVIEEHGSVDGVINNAGIIQPFVRLNDLGYEAIERVIDVNLWGTIHMVKAFLPVLLERPVAHVANVASMGAYLPVPGQTIYGASKAAVKLMTEGLYAELLETGVGVTLVYPGPTETDISGRSGASVGAEERSADDTSIEMTSPEEAARVILDGIESDRLHVIIGRSAKVMNLLSRLAPKQATHLIQRQMKDLLGS